MESLSAGQLCPHRCGGRLYSINPGILINIKGQNLASVDKYWIEKLRCALCPECPAEFFNVNLLQAFLFQ
ncbi:hypothetical protein EP47_01770 [Legionella norrlandica]|uniref:Uncharacterized protein n=1 Tax=Legionella norrlandica TaxID=1498499 RepID=A0A0A2SSD0_9GAMM|nr:hypothetical protein [Legionella norrlandica]KGP62324.1 hypothetical protein EP47_01770 [Legionella norrlandica]